MPLTTHIHSLKVSLHGSLAATGMGHMTPHSVLLGLMGEDPESVQVGRLAKVMDEVGAVGEIELGQHEGSKRVKFDLKRDLVSYGVTAWRSPGACSWADMAPEPTAIAPERSTIHRVQRGRGYARDKRVLFGRRRFRREFLKPGQVTARASTDQR